MSKEPRGLTSSYRQSGAGAPYAKDQPPRSTAAVASAAASGRDESKYPYVDIHNFGKMAKREKPLPPDRNQEAVMGAKLYQFEQHVQFRCGRCRKDGITADCLAADTHLGMLICTRCFSRKIRPKHYKPTRVVPFPSLLTWLNYKPQEVMNDVNVEDVTERAADIVAPSGHRVAAAATESSDIRAITETAMNPMGATGQLESGGQDVLRAAGVEHNTVGSAAAQDTHPCIRVWGKCVHGEHCIFRQAPYNLCIAFLMGLCNDKNCPLLHQHVLDLPDSIGKGEDALDCLPPPARYHDENHPKAGDFKKWVDRRRNSRNRAEWQHYNNGPLEGLFNQYLPEPLDEAAPVAPVKLNLGSIMGALNKVKK